MITSCIAIIFGFRFFGRGLHEISGEEMAIIAFFMLFLFGTLTIRTFQCACTAMYG